MNAIRKTETTLLNPTGVHPAADIFPMMPEDELVDLAEDIKANGLIHPIVLDDDGKIVDGRNRLRACEIAGVQPRFEPLKDKDPVEFVVSENIARRNMSPTQRAMAFAMLHPVPKKAGPGRGHKEKLCESQDFSPALVSRARKIIEYSKELALDVLNRGTPFDVALRQAQEAEQKRKAHDAQMAELHTKAPDVAALVQDGRLTIEAGRAELQERQQVVRRTIDEARHAAKQVMMLSSLLTVIKAVNRLTDAQLAMIEEDREEADPFARFTATDIDAAIAAAQELPDVLNPPIEDE
jgi:ParB-like nuclease domain